MSTHRTKALANLVELTRLLQIKKEERKNDQTENDAKDFAMFATAIHDSPSLTGPSTKGKNQL